MDMYDAVMQENLWKDFMGDEVTDFIDYDYKAKLEDDILKIHIPEKIPPIKKEQAIHKNELQVILLE